MQKMFALNLTNTSIRYTYHLIINFLTEIINFIPQNICQNYRDFTPTFPRHYGDITPELWICYGNVMVMLW